MAELIYDNPVSALKATDEFYANHDGFQYTEEFVTKWIKQQINIPSKGKVLDLCCGDGIWSKGFQNINPKLELFGVDISVGGIEKARMLLNADEKHFIIADTEADMPFEDNFFDLIFARGPGLYNQHNMDRPETIRVIEYWHRLLSNSGIFYSIFASIPHLMGSYTSMEDVKLPYNRAPRKTGTVDFRGGKYHHTIQSFLSPFWKAENVRIKQYRFLNTVHILETTVQ